MEDQRVSVETAKLAKAKGFTCNSYDCHWIPINENSMAMQYDPKTCTLIPTQSLLQKWLREKHHIDITVMVRFADTYGVFIHKNRSIPKGFEEIILKVTYENHKNLYEAALEIGLDRGLLLIN